MGPWANAGIVMSTPVDKVVPAFRPGSGVIGDFVGGQSGVTADTLGEVIEVARHVVVRHDKLARLVQAKKWRVRLDGQLVKREMFGRLGNRALEFMRPVLGGLARSSLDKVERVTVENGTGDRNGIERFLRRVEPAKFLQGCIVERLHPERNAVDAGGTEPTKARSFHTGWIGLQGYFDVWRDSPVLTDAIKDCLYRRGLHQRRSATTEKNARHGASGRTRSCCGDFGLVGSYKACFVDAAVPHVAVEIAIGAFREAEWPMYVDGKGRC